MHVYCTGVEYCTCQSNATPHSALRLLLVMNYSTSGSGRGQSGELGTVRFVVGEDFPTDVS
jgi:hypothetical protein